MAWKDYKYQCLSCLCIFCASGSGVLQAKKTLQSRRQKHRKLQWFLKLCFEKRKLARSFMAASDVFFEIHVLKNIEKQEMACMFGAFLHFFYRSFAFLDPRAWRTRNLCLCKAVLARQHVHQNLQDIAAVGGRHYEQQARGGCCCFCCCRWCRRRCYASAFSMSSSRSASHPYSHSCNHTTCASDPPFALPGRRAR